MNLSLREIASGGGDLTRRLAVSTRDEAGQASSAFNDFVVKLSAIIASVDEASAHLTDTGDELAVNLTQTASAVNQIPANTEGMRRRVAEQGSRLGGTSEAISSISSSLSELDSRIEGQAANVAESSASIGEMVANLRSMTKSVSLLGGEFAVLVQAAAIEATHAGDSGKGFSVVADEIRKLAEMAARQSRQVKANISSITRDIATIVGGAKEAESSFDETLAQIRKLERLEEELRNSMTEQDEVSKQVLEALAEINTITHELRSRSQEMARTSVSIRDSAATLLGKTSNIMKGMQEIRPARTRSTRPSTILRSSESETRTVSPPCARRPAASSTLDTPLSLELLDQQIHVDLKAIEALLEPSEELRPGAAGEGHGVLLGRRAARSRNLPLGLPPADPP